MERYNNCFGIHKVANGWVKQKQAILKFKQKSSVCKTRLENCLKYKLKIICLLTLLFSCRLFNQSICPYYFKNGFSMLTDLFSCFCHFKLLQMFINWNLITCKVIKLQFPSWRFCSFFKIWSERALSCGWLRKMIISRNPFINNSKLVIYKRITANKRSPAGYYQKPENWMVIIDCSNKLVSKEFCAHSSERFLLFLSYVNHKETPNYSHEWLHPGDFIVETGIYSEHAMLGSEPFICIFHRFCKCLRKNLIFCANFYRYLFLQEDEFGPRPTCTLCMSRPYNFCTLLKMPGSK